MRKCLLLIALLVDGLFMVAAACSNSAAVGPTENYTWPQDPAAGSQKAATVLHPAGMDDPGIYCDIYVQGRAFPGTTLLADNHDAGKPRVIEVTMLGQVVWQYVVPVALARYTNPGFDAEKLPGGNVLFLLPRYGVFEVDRQGKVVWNCIDGRVSHDADRLANGNTLVAWGNDSKQDMQAREINPAGEVVWSWRAFDHFNYGPYKDIFDDGWTHCNAVERLSNGNTLISLRNFDFVVEAAPSGEVVRRYGEGIFGDQHDPELLPDGHILAANHTPPPPNHAVEIDPATNKIVWSFGGGQWVPQLARDADRLPNGNTLVCGTDQVVEVTPAGEIVWRLRLRDKIQREEAPSRGFYKAERYAYPAAGDGR